MNVEFVRQLRESGCTAEEAERAIREELAARITSPAALTAHAARWMNYFFHDDPERAYREVIAEHYKRCADKFYTKPEDEANALIETLAMQGSETTPATTGAKGHGLPVAHIMDYPYPPEFRPKNIKKLMVGLRLKDGAVRRELLCDLIYAVNRYKLDVIADKTRHAGILDALKNPDGAFTHTWAARKWIERHGGKDQDPHKARIKFRSINTKSKRWAKHALATSLARILTEYTTEAVNTSREIEGAETKNGALAEIFQAVLTLVDGFPLSDPFPYLKFTSSKL